MGSMSQPESSSCSGWYGAHRTDLPAGQRQLLQGIAQRLRAAWSATETDLEAVQGMQQHAPWSAQAILSSLEQTCWLKSTGKAGVSSGFNVALVTTARAILIGMRSNGQHAYSHL